MPTPSYAPPDRGRRPWPRRLARGLARAAVAAAASMLLAVGGAELALRVGPARPAMFTGKRMAAGRDYRVSYAYDDTGRPASDTDHVGPAFFFASHYGTPLRVRTFGVGTFRFARLAGGAAGRGSGTPALEWAGGAVLVAWVVGRRSVPRRRLAAPDPT